MSATTTVDPATAPAQPAPPASPAASTTPTFQSPAQGEAERLLAEQREARYRELEERARKADALQEKLTEIENAKLAEEKKYRELYEGEKTAREKQTQEHRRALARAELKALAVAEGIIDPDLVSLIRTPEVAENEDFTAALRTAFETFKGSKPQLFKRATAASVTTATTGEGGDPPPQNTPPKTVNVANMTAAEYRAYKSRFLRDARR